jgi:NAD(P)-dependent dehydrogenase (short-subunit alcohol dehydrogenase family)
MSKTILITGAGSGFGEGAAIGLARNGHNVIATAQISPQVAQLRRKASTLGLNNLRVEKLDLLDPYDVAHAHTWDIDVLFNNAGIGECGPVSEIPIDLVRRNFETNVFAPIVLTQGFIKKWVHAKKPGKIVFTSSMGGLFTPPGYAVYVSTKHALEAIAEAMQQELKPFGIKVQTINPGAYLTGYNETMADTPFRWLDDSKNFTKRAAMRETAGADDRRHAPRSWPGRARCRAAIRQRWHLCGPDQRNAARRHSERSRTRTGARPPGARRGAHAASCGRGGRLGRGAVRRRNSQRDENSDRGAGSSARGARPLDAGRRMSARAAPIRRWSGVGTAHRSFGSA